MLFSLGEIKLAKHMPDDALTNLSKAVELFKAVGDKEMAVKAMVTMTGAYVKKYAKDEALQSAKDPVALAQEAGDKTSEGKADLWVAMAQVESGGLSDALET